MHAKQETDTFSLEELTIPGVREAYQKLQNDKGEVDLEKLAARLHKESSSDNVFELISALPAPPDEALEGVIGEEENISTETQKEIIKLQIETLIRENGSLEELALDFAEELFLSGHAKPARVGEETYDLLCEVAEKLRELRHAPTQQRAPKSNRCVRTLKELSSQLVDFATSYSELKSPDYVALNEQFTVIAEALNSELTTFFKKAPKKLRNYLETEGIAPLSEASSWGNYKQNHIGKLIKAGVLTKERPEKNNALVIYSSSSVNTGSFEALVPPQLREAISEALWNEFKTKYSGHYESLGTEHTRENGSLTLRDQTRLNKVAEQAGVSVELVKASLSYLTEHKLLKVEDGGYQLSDSGKHAGIGLGAIRFIQRAQEHQVSTGDKVSLEDYLNAARNIRESWKTPTYTLESKDGGCPWVFLVDELYAGNARIDTKILKALIKNIQESDDALVIASNMLQGNAAVEPRAMRTSIPPSETGGVDMRDYENQIAFVKELLSSLGHPVLQLHGKNDLETANLKADVQRERDLQTLKGIQKSDDQDIQKALASLNDITHRAQRKYKAKLQAEILDLVANVVMPLELKLGRALMDSSQVWEKARLHTNELEIVRDIVSLLAKDQQMGTGLGRQKAEALYGDFLKLPEVGKDYLDKLERVLFPEKETLSAAEPVARGGASVQLVTPDGAEGLRILGLPEARFGLSEAMNPTAKLVELIKSVTLAGGEVPDIITVGATGQPYLSMTAGGTLIVSADTLQSSDFSDLYFATESQDRHKRRRWSRGGESYGGSIAFRGGVHDGIKTDAYTLRLWNHKIQEVLEQNAARGLPSQYVDIYSTSDWQTGSPTAKPVTWLRGLFWAVMNGQKELVINGDIFQGQNYGRAPAEMQLTGLVGIEDQQAFVHALLNPVLDAIKHMKEKDPDFELPRWRILTGNHETNSQAGRGGQGIWFLQTMASQIESYYRGAFGAEAAEASVLYPKKFVDRMGVDVDYAHMMLDFSDQVGFRLAAQHYVGVGAKGSSSVPPIKAAATWARSLENELRPIHGFLLGHWHTQSVTQADGLFYTIFGANADKSGFEWHLGYPTTVPASGRVRLYSDRPPELFFITDPYLRLQEEQFMGLEVYQELISKHGSLEDFVEYERARHQRRDQKSFSYAECDLKGHSFLEPHRQIGGNDKGRKSAA